MKKLLYIIPALALALTAQSCKDDDFSKHSIDDQYQIADIPTATSSVAPVVNDFQHVTLSASLSDVSNIVEQGFQISKSEDFSDPLYFANDTIETDYTITTEGLEGSTTYYARSYAITTAGGYVFGEAQTFTTPKTPIFKLNGIYTVIDYYYNRDVSEWEAESEYKIAIEFDPDSEDGTDVFIYNFGGIDPTVAVSGVYDEEEQKVYIPVNQYLGDYGTYGAVRFNGVNDSFTAYSNEVVLSFTPLQGLLSSSVYNPFVSAGSFGFYRFEGAHDPEEE